MKSKLNDLLRPFLLISLIGFALLLLAFCNKTPIAADMPIPTTTSASSSWTAVTEPARYHRLPAPLIPRAQSDETSLLEVGIGLQTGKYRVEYDGQQFLIIPPTGDSALSLTLPGGDALNILAADPDIVMQKTAAGEQITLTGQSEWADFQAVLYAYNFHPGLLRWRFEIMRHGDPPASPEPELHFVNRATGEETSALLETYSDRGPMAAPHLFAYSEALDSSLFYWVDLTALNPFMEMAHYTPSATPRRIKQRVGHSFSRNDLSQQPEGVVTVLYDSYLYLTPGQPADEDAMFGRYLHNLGDIYDLIAIPDDPLPAWFDVTQWGGQGHDGVDVCDRPRCRRRRRRGSGCRR